MPVKIKAFVSARYTLVGTNSTCAKVGVYSFVGNIIVMHAKNKLEEEIPTPEAAVIKMQIVYFTKNISKCLFPIKSSFFGNPFSSS